MGKKTFAVVIIAVVTIFAGYNMYQSQSTVILSDLALANVEALANNGESGGNKVICYSSSSSKSGASYYDCGPCSREFNSIGTGSSSECIYYK